MLNRLAPRARSLFVRVGRRATSDLLVIFLARAATIGGQLLYLHLYSSRLSVHELGVYFFLLTISYTFNAVVFVPLDYYQQAKVRQLLESDGSLRVLLRLNGRVVLAVFAVGMIAAGAVAFYSLKYAVMGVAALAVSLFLHVTLSLRGLLNNLMYRRASALSQILEIVVKYALSWLLIVQVAATAGALIGALATTLCMVALMLAVVAKNRNLFDRPSGDRTVLDRRHIFHFTYPLSIAACSSWLQLQGYRFVLVPLGFTEVVGLYATVSNVGAAAMNAMASIFGQMFIPEIYRTSGRYTMKYLRNAGIVILIMLAVIGFTSAWLVNLATSGKLVPYAYLTIFGVVTEAANFLAGALAIHLTIKHHSRKLLWASLLAGGSSIALSFALWATDNLSLSTLGLPIILSQLFAIAYLYHCCRHDQQAVVPH